MKCRIVVPVVIGAIVVAGAMGLSGCSGSSGGGKATTTTTAATPSWYGAQTAAACSPLRRWHTATVAAYTTLTNKDAWTAKRAALTTQGSASVAALEALESFATPAGKAEIAFVSANTKQLNTALATAGSAAEYSRAQLTLGKVSRWTKDIAILQADVAKCPTT